MASAPQPDFQKLGDEMYKHWEKAMTQWWDTTLESPAFLGAMGKNLESAARARGQYEKAVDQSLEKMHLPTRGDLVRVARVAALLEERLLQQEDHVLELKDRLARMEKEVVEARIEAAEARLELRETLAAIRGELATARAPSPASPVAKADAPPAAATRRKGK
ncbi:MAG: hypothetical protein FJ102_26855 [Deltaproteobacteria bacterium]|nr:hypothetical protein [Deltaproteobacteria bacterium]